MADHTSTSNIVEPHLNDVLSGRGNSANRHPGNAHFRDLVKSHRNDYVSCPKQTKPIYAKLIYNEIQSMDPPGRFLKQDPVTKKWSDIGKKAALAKIRQALREGAPEIIRDRQTMEQFSRCSETEVAQTLGVAGSIQNATNQVISNSSGISKDPSAPNVPSSSLGPANHLVLGNSNSVCQLSDYASSQNASSATGQFVTESSASSLSGDSVSFSPTRPDSLLGSIQATQQLETLLHLQRAFQQANPQTNQVNQTLAALLNNTNAPQQTHQGFYNSSIVPSASMLNPQQQLSNGLDISGSQQQTHQGLGNPSIVNYAPIPNPQPQQQLRNGLDNSGSQQQSHQGFYNPSIVNSASMPNPQQQLSNELDNSDSQQAAVCWHCFSTAEPGHIKCNALEASGKNTCQRFIINAHEDNIGTSYTSLIS